MLRYAKPALVAFGMATAAAPALADRDTNLDKPYVPNPNAYEIVNVTGWNKIACIKKEIAHAFSNDPHMQDADQCKQGGACLAGGVAMANFETGKADVSVVLEAAEKTTKVVDGELVQPFLLSVNMQLEAPNRNSKDITRWYITSTGFSMQDHLKAEGRKTPATMLITYDRFSNDGFLSNKFDNMTLPAGADPNEAYHIIERQVKLKDKIHECVMYVN